MGLKGKSGWAKQSTRMQIESELNAADLVRQAEINLLQIITKLNNHQQQL